MNKNELADRVGAAKETLVSHVGDISSTIGVIPGTGWKEGVDQAFVEDLAVPYSSLMLPGFNREDQGDGIPGHSKSLRLGKIDGKDVLVIGRVHANESKDPEITLATRVVIEAVRQQLKGLIVTHGVGSLSGWIDQPKHLTLETLPQAVRGLVRTLIIDTLGWAHRGRRINPVAVGEIAVVEDILTRHFGDGSPLLAGEFVDPYYGGLHRENSRYLHFAREAVLAVQGTAPSVVYSYVQGPQFETFADKLAFRSTGGEVIGMSGHEVSVAAALDLPVVQIVLATNGPFAAHSHEGNQAMGSANEAKAAEVLRRLVSHWPQPTQG